MNLYQRILLERITDPAQLGVAERAQLKSDPALEAAIRENLALARLQAEPGWAPDREALLSFARAQLHNGGNPMTLIQRMFCGRTWYFQLGAALALLAAVTVLALVPRGHTLAQTNGYVLKFDYGQVGGADGGEESHALIDERLAELQSAVEAWAEQQLPAGPDGEHRCEALINVNNNNGHLTAMVSLVDAPREVLEDLASALAELPGVPQPTITDATWFYPGGKFDPNAGVSFSVMEHMFTFPREATEAEIEQTINAWLKDNRPEFKGTADVTIQRTAASEDGSERERVEIKIALVEAVAD